MSRIYVSNCCSSLQMRQWNSIQHYCTAAVQWGRSPHTLPPGTELAHVAEAHIHTRTHRNICVTHWTLDSCALTLHTNNTHKHTLLFPLCTDSLIAHWKAIKPALCVCVSHKAAVIGNKQCDPESVSQPNFSKETRTLSHGGRSHLRPED